MRIALVITELDPGGAETCLTELALHLQHLGHIVQVLSIGPMPTTHRNVLVQRLVAAGIELHFGNATSGRQVVRIVGWLRRELKRFRPDVVQSMLWHANVATAAAMWFNSIPLVGGMRVSEPRRSRWRWERWALRRMQRLVCVSRDVYQHALQQQHMAAAKLLVIPNGVSQAWLSDTLPAGDWQQLIQQPLQQPMLFVGRLEPQKGVLPLMEHLPQIFAGHAETSLIVMGQGSQYPAVVARIQAQSELRDRVHLVGWQPNAPNWMKAAALLLLPAEYEGMPNVLLEAMAVGRPFVAFAVDGVQQLLDSADGYPAKLASAQLAAPGNWHDFIRLVRTQLEQPELGRRCGQANRQHVIEHFRLPVQLDRYVQLYAQLTSATRR